MTFLEAYQRSLQNMAKFHDDEQAFKDAQAIEYRRREQGEIDAEELTLP